MVAVFQITGLKPAIKALKTLDAKVAKKVLRQSMRKALKPMQQAVKAEAPVRTGALKRAIKVRAGKRKRGQVSVVVAASSKDFTGKTFYASIIEYGSGKHSTRQRTTKKRNRKRKTNFEGHRPNPFMLRGFEKTKNAVRDDAIKLILAGVEKEAAKAAKGA